jgi:hypothetical protein
MKNEHQSSKPKLTVIEGGKKDEKPLTREEVVALWDQLAPQPTPVPVSLESCVGLGDLN